MSVECAKRENQKNELSMRINKEFRLNWIICQFLTARKDFLLLNFAVTVRGGILYLDQSPTIYKFPTYNLFDILLRQHFFFAQITAFSSSHYYYY